MTNESARPDCPRCGQPDPTLFVYGLILFEEFEKTGLTNVNFAGCCIELDSPEWQCEACGLTWGRIEWASSEDASS